MRNTILPPWLRAESHAHRQLNTLPRCMRPEGDGAKRPTTEVGAGASLLLVAVDAATAGVAMLHALISMRTSIARGAVGETLRGLQVADAACCARRAPTQHPDCPPKLSPFNPSNDRNPGSSSQLPGFPRKRGT